MSVNAPSLISFSLLGAVFLDAILASCIIFFENYSRKQYADIGQYRYHLAFNKNLLLLSIFLLAPTLLLLGWLKLLLFAFTYFALQGFLSPLLLISRLEKENIISCSFLGSSALWGIIIYTLAQSPDLHLISSAANFQIIDIMIIHLFFFNISCCALATEAFKRYKSSRKMLQLCTIRCVLHICSVWLHVNAIILLKQVMVGLIYG